MEKYIIIDKQTSQFFCRLSTGLVIAIRDFSLADRFLSMTDVRNFLKDQEIETNEVYIVQELNITNKEYPIEDGCGAYVSRI